MTLGTLRTLGVLIIQGSKLCHGERSSVQTRAQSVSGGGTMQWQLRCCLLASTYSKTQLSEYLLHQLGGFVLQETEYSSLSIMSGLLYAGASLVAQIVKNLCVVQEIKV